MHPRKALLVKAKLKKMLDAKFIEAIAYLEWVFIVPKLDGRTIICTDFKYVNKACPKDDFLLSNIDTLVDNSVGHEMFSLMDNFLRYNKIIIAEEGRNK